MKYVAWIMCIWLFTSCNESREETMLRLVKEWKGKSVIIPARSVFTIQGKETVDFQYQDADYKILTYTDSLGCTSCKLQLPRWKQLITEVDSLTSGGVPFLFYFHPQDIQELRFLLHRDKFTYPICLDEDDVLNSLNRFPSDMTFQTLLLDRENKVIAIGNPILNPKVKDLYLEIITGNAGIKSDENLTTVVVDHLEQDFGEFLKQQKQECVFWFTNTGNRLLVIHDVVTSCGCTQVEYSKEPVQPGETLELRVTYEAEDKGRFRKSLKVYCNVENAPLQLTVTGAAK